MTQILVCSGLLIAGIICSQVIDLSQARQSIEALTMICLAYIMIEVGLEFTMIRKRLKVTDWIIWFQRRRLSLTNCFELRVDRVACDLAGVEPGAKSCAYWSIYFNRKILDFKIACKRK